MTEDKMRVFVYGTLKQGGALHNAITHCNLLGDHTTEPKYTMYDLGWYPGVVGNGHTAITGEVYEIDDRMLASLDRVEGFPRLYSRELIQTPYGEAWIYLYNHGIGTDNQRREIPAGVWAV